ncbi:MAG: SBBP repeat-containing protein, partial [Bryobacteraceae bacterium]
MAQQRVLLVIAVLFFELAPCSAQLVAADNRLTHAFADPLFFKGGEGYISMTRDARAYFLKDRVVYKIHHLAFQAEFLDASGIDPEGEDRQAGVVNCLTGNRPQDWSTNLPTYKEVVYHGVYRGIDVGFAFAGSRLKSEYVVASGGNPSLIRVRYAGLGAPDIDQGGNLTFMSELGEFREEKPAAFQLRGAARIDVPAAYKIWPDGGVGFELGAFDPTLPLVIDPVVVYSSYFGALGDTAATAVAVDSNGNAYVTGWTDSTDLPTASPLQGFNAGSVDAFVMKVNSAGNTLLYATYIGGAGDDRAYGIAVDGGGNAYVTGTTTSSNFPITLALQASLSGARDAFVLKLNAAGNSLTFSTYLGGSGTEISYGIALDSQGNAYVTGDTTSSNFPTLTPFQASNGGGQDAFVSKISAAGVLVYSTYLGGSGTDHAAAISVDSSGNAYITGGTFSTNFPTATPFQAANAGGEDAFVTKLSPGGNSLVYSTYLGGSGGALGSPEAGAGIAVDTLGDAFVVGSTSSTNFPVAAAVQLIPGAGTMNAFISEFNPFGTGLVYSTYFGGSTQDYGQAIAVDLAGNAYVAGYTGSADMPTVSPIQASLEGSYNAFVLIIGSSGAALNFATYYGGTGLDSANAITLDPSGNVIVAGQTSSANFPIVGGVQGSLLGTFEAFLVKLNPGIAQPDFTLGMSPSSQNVTAGGSNVTYTVTVAAVNGFTGAVSLGVSGLPAGVTGSFNPTSIVGSGTSTLTITAASGAQGGSSTTTATGTSGSDKHTASASLVVAGSSSAAFVKLDTTTQGNWHGIYGDDGYIVIGDLTLNPSYVTPVVSGDAQAVWAASTSDVRALQKASNLSDRVAGLWYTYNTFTVGLNITDGKTHQVALYCLDWDTTARRETVQVLDGNGNVLNTQSLTSSFNGGVYLVWNVSGNVQLRVTLTAGANAVATGLFLGPAGSANPVLGVGETHIGSFIQGQQNAAYTVTVSNASSAAATSGTVTMTETVPAGLTLVSMSGTGWTCVSTNCTRSDALAGGSSYPAITATVNVAASASSPQVNQVSVSGGGSASANWSDSTVVTSNSAATFVKLDTTTQGSWVGTYGANGYIVIGDLTLNPSYVTPTESGETQAVWAASTSDVRALQKASNPASRIAGLWYTYSSFTVSLNITDGKTHQVALYCLDWDTTARRQTVQVLDGNGNVLNTQSLTSSFNGGVYLVWNVSGNVQLRVTLTAGANAVATG